MAVSFHAARSKSLKWLIVALTLIGFWGQIALQGVMLPGDTPRGAILRLTGIDIGSVAGVSTSPAFNHSPASHTHSHHGMSMEPSSHDAMMAADHAEHDHGSGHDADCPLCPLLLLFGVLAGSFVFLPSISSAWLAMRRRHRQPRAPPAFTLAVPPATGPPILI